MTDISAAPERARAELHRGRRATHDPADEPPHACPRRPGHPPQPGRCACTSYGTLGGRAAAGCTVPSRASRPRAVRRRVLRQRPYGRRVLGPGVRRHHTTRPAVPAADGHCVAGPAVRAAARALRRVIEQAAAQPSPPAGQSTTNVALASHLSALALVNLGVTEAWS